MDHNALLWELKPRTHSLGNKFGLWAPHVSLERRFWTSNGIALLCAVARNIKLPPDMIVLTIMLILFVLSVEFPGHGVLQPTVHFQRTNQIISKHNGQIQI